MFPLRAWIPNGAHPFGIFGSLNAFDQRDRLERRVEDVHPRVVEVGRVQAVVQRREPFVDGPARELSTPVTAFVAFTVGAQPRIVPASVAKRNLELLLVVPLLMMKSAALALATVPVGPPATVTTVADFVPAPL